MPHTMLAELRLHIKPETLPDITNDLHTLLRCAVSSPEFAYLPPEQRANILDSASLAYKAAEAVGKTG